MNIIEDTKNKSSIGRLTLVIGLSMTILIFLLPFCCRLDIGPGPHLVLEEGFDYPEGKIYCDQYIVIDPDGAICVYRNWFQDYDPEMITAELEVGGFTVDRLCGDLTGAPWTEDSEWIGVAARRTG